MKWLKIKICFSILFSFAYVNAYAQQAYVDESDVNTIFISGGYGALFGAAMGAAILPFMNGTPMENLRIIAGGASIGFMVGSAYGFYSLANVKRNSYFNYNNNQDDESNYYYSMPPTIPTQGRNNLKKMKPKEVIETNTTPLIGALFMGDIKKLDMAIPYFWVGDKKITFMLASVTF